MDTIVIALPEDDRLRRCRHALEPRHGHRVLAILPPILVVVLMQRWFVKGLVETEK